jgi:asparagine synthase (glutamine-hydrolysing)
LFERPKAGFGVPVGEWVKGPLRAWAEDLLNPAAMRADGWFDADIVQRRWQQHLRGDRDSTSAIWPILMFEAWRREQSSFRTQTLKSSRMTITDSFSFSFKRSPQWG